MKRLRVWAVPVVAAVTVATAPAAFGHGPFGPAKGYVSSVTSIEPNVLGLQASVVGDRLVVRNWSTRTVTILGPDGRPSLRVGRRGVFASSGFGWKRISGGTSYGWHDPRVRWTGRQAPEAVRRHPEQAHLLRAWRVRGSAGGGEEGRGAVDVARTRARRDGRGRARLPRRAEPEPAHRRGRLRLRARYGDATSAGQSFPTPGPFESAQLIRPSGKAFTNGLSGELAAM